MALTRSKKDSLIEGYAEGLADSQHAFLLGFKGITVNQDTELRNKIRSEGGHYAVVKNTLAKRAVDGKSLGQLSDQFVGPTAVAYGEDPVGIAKALTEFRKESPVIEFKGGVVDGQPVSADQIEDIAKMPSREDLLAKLLFLLQSPVTRFVRTLAAIPRDFVVVLDQIAQKKDD